MENKTVLRVAVSGITGRMGKVVAQRIIELQQQNSQEIILSGAIARLNSDVCGMDIGALIHERVLGVSITDNIQSIVNDFDILIDFTSSGIAMEYLNFCVINKKNIVIGTTGFTEKQQNIIEYASQKIGVIYSANFSIGITIMLKLLNDIVKVIDDNVDVNIVETHHKKKYDKPSGTALMMQEVITSMLRQRNFVCSDTMIHSIRSGNIIGEHTVLFTSTEEQLGITHSAFNRVIFANGAIHAAMWLGCFKVGLFTMNDVLGI